MTKKELIEGGWIDKYVLGLTSEAESSEVERLASLYPEVQEQINLGSAAVVFLALVGLAFLWKEHFYLKEDYNYQCAKLAEQQAKVDKMSTVSRQVSERSNFINSSTTERIKVRGCESTPDAEVLLFQCKLSWKMMLQVVDLPSLPDGHHYEVWAKHADNTTRKLGQIQAPIKYDSLYVLDPALHFASLQITDVDPANNSSEPVCMASVSK